MSNGTPVGQDLLSRFLVQTYDEKKVIQVSTGFMAFFGRPETGAETHFSPDANQVDIDIIRGTETIAALVPRGTVSRSIGTAQKNLRAERFTELSRTFPLIEEEDDIDSSTLLNRVAGETPYQRQDRITRLRAQAIKLSQENYRRTIRTQEYLAAQSILTGYMPALLGTANSDYMYNWRRNSAHMVTVATAWSDNNNADCLGDIESACMKIRINGKLPADGILMGQGSMANFIKNLTVQKLADNRRFEFIQFGAGDKAGGVGDDLFNRGGIGKRFSAFIEGGFLPRGILITPEGFELAIFTYIDGYNDPVTGTWTKYLPDDKVVVFSSRARCDRYFGPPENLPMIPMREQLYREFFGFDPLSPPTPPNLKAASGVIRPDTCYHDAYVSADWKRLTIRMQQAPIFATTATDGFVTIDTQP